MKFDGDGELAKKNLVRAKDCVVGKVYAFNGSGAIKDLRLCVSVGRSRHLACLSTGDCKNVDVHKHTQSYNSGSLYKDVTDQYIIKQVV